MDNKVMFPMLAGEIAKRGITKRAIAQRIGVCDKALNNKMNGRSSFTWDEVKIIRHTFFPDMPPEILFANVDELEQASPSNP